MNIILPGYRKTWTIIQVYAPTEKDPHNETRPFYAQLNQTLMKYTRNHIILMGDFNAQIGEKLSRNEYITGNYGHGKRSPNGELLIELAMEHNLTILNSMFKKNKNNKWTWISPGENYKNEIDYIATNYPKAFSDTSVLSRFNFNTNHRMVRSSLKQNQPRNPRNFVKPNKAEQYSNDTLKKVAKSLIDTSKAIKPGNADVIANYNKLEKQLTEVKNGNKKEKYTLSDTTKQLIEERKNLLSSKKRNAKLITDLSKQIKENIRKDRRSRRMQTLEKHIIRTGGVKKALKDLKEVNKEWIPKLDRAGFTCTNRKDINKAATKFYQDLYSNPSKNLDQEEHNYTIKAERQTEESEPEILPREIEKAVLSQKSEKAPGPDKIVNELLKGTLEDLLPVLTLIFNEIMTTGIIPSQWKISHIILIHKKGKKEDLGNYRPISLLSNIYKVFSKVILGRISKKLDENQPREQAGFRQNFSTIDHIHTVKQIMEKYNEYNKKFYMAFIDYYKAFDSISHEAIWESLEQQGIPLIYIRILMNIYSNSEARVQLDSIGKKFEIQRGLKQGDPLSPKIFSAVLESIFRKLNWSDFGLNIDGVKLNHLRFADDIILVEENPIYLEEMIETLRVESEKVGLVMNRDKTKLLTNSTPITIQIDGQPLEYVNEYIYLGQTISHEDQTTKEITRRIVNGWKKYWSLKEIFKCNEFSMSIKRKVFNTCVLPVITYGCETWSLTKQHREKLERCQRAMERSITGIKKTGESKEHHDKGKNQSHGHTHAHRQAEVEMVWAHDSGHTQ